MWTHSLVVLAAMLNIGCIQKDRDYALQRTVDKAAFQVR